MNSANLSASLNFLGTFLSESVHYDSQPALCSLIRSNEEPSNNNVASIKGRFQWPDGFYQHAGEIIAFARPDLAVSGMGSLSVAPVVGIRAMSAA